MALPKRDWLEMTWEEIAELQAVSRKTVGARLARVREEVHALVGERDQEAR